MWQLAGSEFDDSRRAARLNTQHIFEKLWMPKASEATDLGIASGDDTAFVSDDAFMRSSSPKHFVKADTCGARCLDTALLMLNFLGSFFVIISIFMGLVTLALP